MKKKKIKVVNCSVGVVEKSIHENCCIKKRGKDLDNDLLTIKCHSVKIQERALYCACRLLVRVSCAKHFPFKHFFKLAKIKQLENIEKQLPDLLEVTSHLEFSQINLTLGEAVFLCPPHTSRFFVSRQKFFTGSGLVGQYLALLDLKMSFRALSGLVRPCRLVCGGPRHFVGALWRRSQ